MCPTENQLAKFLKSWVGDSTPSIMTSAITALLSVLLFAQNLGTLSSRLRSTKLSWLPAINLSIVSKLVRFTSKANLGPSEIGSSTSNFRNTQTGQLMLRGLFHQKMYITKFMAAYASVTISRCVTGRRSTALAMHCITNHDVWRRAKDLASQSLLPLSLISASVGTVNEEKSTSRIVSFP